MARRRRSPTPEPQPDPRHFPRPVEPVPDPALLPEIHPNDEERHPFLRFTREDDREDRDYLEGLAAKHGYAPLRYIVWESLHAVSLRGRAERVCGPHWRRLFSIDQQVCQELAIEFFSTFHLVTPLTDYAQEDALTFRLCGAERRLSLRQFAVYMGLYLQDELDTPAFTEGITSWPDGVNAVGFWPEVGIGSYTSPTIPKSTKLRDPLHRVLHRAIVYSLNARGDSSSGNITHADLFYLYCMVHSTPCQIAERLARFLFSIRRSRVTQGIYGGGYVYKLAQAMDIIPVEGIDVLTITSPASAINMDVLFKMKVVGKVGRRSVLLDHRGQPWVPLPTGGDDGAGGSGSGGGGDQHHTEQEIPQQEVRPPSQQPEQSQQRSQVVTYSRDYRGRLDAIERSIADIREIQRLEFAHAEAHRLYTARMLRSLVASSNLAPITSVEEPPVPPQRLADFYAQAGPSQRPDSDQQPPP